ncbi:MAG: LCP family protein [Fimbriimonas sp.]|nr:LCP family protein [Fimbriimonas sp.]
MKKKPTQTSMARRAFGGAGYCLVLFLALAFGTIAGWIKQSDVISKILFNPPAPKEAFHANSVTLLILGCDEDVADFTHKILKKYARSDMMLVARLDFDHNMITGVSIPRDTECRLPGYKRMKINAYHELAKKDQAAELTQQAVEYLLPGVKIDRVVTLDFDAFQQMVDLVGGVPIVVDKKMDYEDNAGNLHIHFKPGYQMMNGYQAMCFVRFRHADSDLVRQQRQKQFLIAFKNQVLKDWLQLPSIVNQGVGVINNALSIDEIASLARFAKAVPPTNIQWGQIPVVDSSGSYLKVVKSKLPKVLAQYRLIDAPASTSSSDSGDAQ